MLGRLAVDSRVQRRKLGELLLIDALKRVCDAALLVGCIGVVVDAKNAAAEVFYAKYDFVALPPRQSPQRMFMAIGTLRETLIYGP